MNKVWLLVASIAMVLRSSNNNEVPDRAGVLDRQSELPREAVQAAVNAARAAQATAKYTRRTARYMLISVIVVFMTVIVTPVLSSYLTRHDENVAEMKKCKSLVVSLFDMATFAHEVAELAASSVAAPIPPNTTSNKFSLPPIDEIIHSEDQFLDILDQPSRDAILDLEARYRALRDDLSSTPGIYHTGETFGVPAASGDTYAYEHLLGLLTQTAKGTMQRLQSPNTAQHCKDLASTRIF